MLAGFLHPPLHWRYAFVTASAFLLLVTVDAGRWLPREEKIPDAAGKVRPRRLVPLSTLRPGESGEVRQIICRERGQLRHLESIGLVPGAAVRVSVLDPGSGVMRVDLDGRPDEPIGESICGCVLVSRTGGTA